MKDNPHGMLVRMWEIWNGGKKIEESADCPSMCTAREVWETTGRMFA